MYTYRLLRNNVTFLGLRPLNVIYISCVIQVSIKTAISLLQSHPPDPFLRGGAYCDKRHPGEKGLGDNGVYIIYESTNSPYRAIWLYLNSIVYIETRSIHKIPHVTRSTQQSIYQWLVTVEGSVTKPSDRRNLKFEFKFPKFQVNFTLNFKFQSVRNFPEIYRNLEIIDDCSVTKDFYILLLGMLMLFKSVSNQCELMLIRLRKFTEKWEFRITYSRKYRFRYKV